MQCWTNTWKWASTQLTSSNLFVSESKLFKCFGCPCLRFVQNQNFGWVQRFAWTIAYEMYDIQPQPIFFVTCWKMFYTTYRWQVLRHIWPATTSLALNFCVEGFLKAFIGRYINLDAATYELRMLPTGISPFSTTRTYFSIQLFIKEYNRTSCNITLQLSSSKKRYVTHTGHALASLLRSPCWQFPFKINRRKCWKTPLLVFEDIHVPSALLLLLPYFSANSRNNNFLLRRSTGERKKCPGERGGTRHASAPWSLWPMWKVTKKKTSITLVLGQDSITLMYHIDNIWLTGCKLAK